MYSWTETSGSQMMHSSDDFFGAVEYLDFSDMDTFPLVPPSGHNFNVCTILLYDQIPANPMIS